MENQSGVAEMRVFYPEALFPNVEGVTLSLPYLPRTAVGDGELAQAVVVDAGVREGTFLQRVGPQQGFQAAAILRDQPFLLQGLIGVCKEPAKGKGREKSGWNVGTRRDPIVASHVRKLPRRSGVRRRGLPTLTDVYHHPALLGHGIAKKNPNPLTP